MGKGRYIVNAQGVCNDCHNPNGPGNEFSPGHNPYLLVFTPPAQDNPATHLAGGAPFGPFPGTGNFVPPGMPQGCTCMPEPDARLRKLAVYQPAARRGTSFQDFMTIIRTGHDFDNAHPVCPAMGVDGCITPSGGPILRPTPLAEA